MSVINFIRKIISRPEGGLFEKLGQIEPEERSVKNCKLAQYILPKNILKNVDIQNVAIHRGTIGIIYTGYYRGRKIAIKVVSEETKKNVKRDLQSINFLGNLASRIFPHVSPMTDEISDKLHCETKMDRERQMAELIQLKVTGLLLDKVEFLVPVPQFSKTKNVFVYYYVNGVSLDKVKNTSNPILIERIGKRIALSFFKTLYECQIIFGDMNPGNFLYDFETDTVSFIDYGCVFELESKQISQLAELHRAQKSRKKLREYLKSWDAPQLLSDSIYDKSRIFWEENPNTNNISFSDILQITNVADCKLPPEMILTIRAIYQLIGLENWLGCSCVISDYLNTI